MRLHAAATAAGFGLLAHDTINSTNAEALTLARTGAAGPFWITARRQTAGRGRRGKEWISIPGNLYATLLLIDPAPPARSAELSFVAALAVHDAIADRAPELQPRLSLKWPNDVLHNDAKLAGILLESEHAAQRLAVAIGIGINCRHHPAQTAFPATDLCAAGADVSVEAMFEALSFAMFRQLAQWHGGVGFAESRADWLVRSHGIGAEMVVRLPGRELQGRCEALDDRGRLLLRLADGSVQAITAGDVFPAAGDASAQSSPRPLATRAVD